MVKKFDVYFCDVKGHEKPCVVVSPDEMNATLPYVLIAPITKALRAFPCRIGVKLKGQPAQVAFDMIRSIPRDSLVHRLGHLPDNLQREMLDVLKDLFCDK